MPSKKAARPVRSAAVRATLKQLAHRLKAIGAERDALRELAADCEDLAHSCDDAVESIESAIEALSRYA